MNAIRLDDLHVRTALATLAKAVVNIDPFDFVAAPGRFARLATAGPFHLRPREFEAFREVVGDSPLFLANLGVDRQVFTPNVWEVSTSTFPFEALKSDPEWNGIASSVLWTVDGVWVVVVSDEGHAVLVGPPALVETLQSRLPHGGDSVDEIAARLYVGTPEAKDADEALVRMIGRLYGRNASRRLTNDPDAP